MNNKEMLSHLESLKGFFNHKSKYSKTEKEREEARQELDIISKKLVEATV
jgi:hypothetical protein